MQDAPARAGSLVGRETANGCSSRMTLSSSRPRLRLETRRTGSAATVPWLVSSSCGEIDIKSARSKEARVRVYDEH